MLMDTPVGAELHAVIAWQVPATYGLTLQAEPDWAAHSCRTLAGAVARAHAVGAPVLAWTVDTTTDLERVLAAGVDGVITDDPRIFESVAA